jgi:AcrR family transcriptional regulator
LPWVYNPTDSRSDYLVVMSRTRNAAAHAVRRDEILDVAEGLIRTRGYEAMSVQSVQDELGCSRGAIYHYFGSKESILGAVIERMTAIGMAVLAPIAADASLDAAGKLQALFAVAGSWKSERSDLLLPLIRSWYQPGNDIARVRAEAAAYEEFRPLIAAILRQGVAEGAMNPSSADHAAVILTALLAGSTDAIRRLLIDRLDGRVPFEEVERFIHAYNEAIERILGLPAGSFALIDPASLRVWFA